MAVNLIKKPRKSQPNKTVRLSSQYESKKPICAFIPGISNVEIVRGITFVPENSPTTGVVRGDKTLVSTAAGSSYVGIRAPETSSGSRSDLFYDPASPPLTLITVSTTNQNYGSALIRSNGSGSAAFSSGAWYGSFTGGYVSVKTTGGEITISPDTFYVDTRYVPVINVVSIGVSMTRLWCGLIGGPCFQEYSAATPSGNFYYEYSDKYRVLSVGGGYTGFATNTILAASFGSEFSRADALSIIANPWKIFEPETIPLFYSTVTAQFLRPISDVSNSGWTPSTGSDLFAMFNETVRDDATYISATAPGSTFEVLLGTSAGDPQSSINHLPSIVMSAGSGGILLRLKQGTTTIKEWTYASLATSDTLYEPSLTAGEIDTITDYTNLRLYGETTA